MAPTKKSSSAKAAKVPAKKPMVVKKSQYELERDERIKRNEKFMLSIGLNPYGSGGYVKQNTTKAPPKPRGPKKYICARVPAPPLGAPPGRDGRARAPDLRQLVGR